MINFCGYCNELIPKSEDIIKLIDSDYGILCPKHSKQMNELGYLEDE
jgi:hypothetical protein